MTNKELLRVIAQKMAWIIVVLLAYLGYYVEVRPYFGSYHGIWSIGFFDGVIVTSTLSLIGFYVWSILTNPEE